MPVAKGNVGHRQRLRERFLDGEERALSEEGLVELLLTFASPQKDVQPLTRSLLQQFGSLQGITSASPIALEKVPGIGCATIALLKLVEHIVVRKHRKMEPVSASQPPAVPTLFPLEGAKGWGLFSSPIGDGQELPSGRRRNRVRRVAPKPTRIQLKKGTGLFGKGLLKDAIQCLPRLPDTDSLDEVRRFLREGGLHYSSAQTRSRYAQYVSRRMFPAGVADQAVRLFAKHFDGTQALRDICFYRFLKAEPVVEPCLREVLLPSIGRGTLPRASILQYLAERFHDAKPRTIQDTANAIVDVLVAAGLVKGQRHQLLFRYREVCLESFAFILHSEFSEPGMYDIEKVQSASIFSALLWPADQLVRALYELRNKGLIAKVSEIDQMRQVTLRYDLDGVVQKMVEGRVAQ
jgi:DNA repair protein RadC